MDALAWLLGALGGSWTVGRLLEAFAHLLEGLGGIWKALGGTLEAPGRLLGGSWRPRRRIVRLFELVLEANVVPLTSIRTSLGADLGGFRGFLAVEQAKRTNFCDCHRTQQILFKK